MSLPNRPLNPSLRHPSIGSFQSSTGPSPVLVARINEKKAELENLKQLRDLSGALAAQMQALEEKLSTLSSGTEGKNHQQRTTTHVQILTGKLNTVVATVISNWHNVMAAINMASSTPTIHLKRDFTTTKNAAVKVPKPADDQAEAIDPEPQTLLPQTLVRIPIEHQTEALQAQNGQNNSS